MVRSHKRVNYKDSPIFVWDLKTGLINRCVGINATVEFVSDLYRAEEAGVAPVTASTIRSSMSVYNTGIGLARGRFCFRFDRADFPKISYQRYLDSQRFGHLMQIYDESTETLYSRRIDKKKYKEFIKKHNLDEITIFSALIDHRYPFDDPMVEARFESDPRPITNMDADWPYG